MADFRFGMGPPWAPSLGDRPNSASNQERLQDLENRIESLERERRLNNQHVRSGVWYLQPHDRVVSLSDQDRGNGENVASKERHIDFGISFREPPHVIFSLNNFNFGNNHTKFFIFGATPEKITCTGCEVGLKCINFTHLEWITVYWTAIGTV
eukprot:TRINITY_DN11267_c0_g1_i1.p1 TRINITY_DN11267_c0_g1~~TRINITY_DN11267_c0_g1_i1.p1  ORF type:complete len:153 (-),score=16.83 TRINITY_DN11267_c0_g1_i1:128-586(-)